MPIQWPPFHNRKGCSHLPVDGYMRDAFKNAMASWLLFYYALHCLWCFTIKMLLRESYESWFEVILMATFCDSRFRYSFFNFICVIVPSPTVCWETINMPGPHPMSFHVLSSYLAIRSFCHKNDYVWSHEEPLPFTPRQRDAIYIFIWVFLV